MWRFSPFVWTQFEPDQKMIVFFSSCELVEFHHSLFLQTLLGGSGALAPGRLPSASRPLTFLRLHGDMEQEVSWAPLGWGGSWLEGAPPEARRAPLRCRRG